MAKGADERTLQCCLCPVTGGALKPTTIPGLWAHLTCMQWIPEVFVLVRESVCDGCMVGHASIPSADPVS